MLRHMLAVSGILLVALELHAGPKPAVGAVSGIVTFEGKAPKRAALDLAKDPDCLKMHANDPLTDETIVTGHGNALANVVVYIYSEGDSAAPAGSAVFDQEGCHYKTHVLAVRTGQEIKIMNSDPISHNIHPLAKVNREWNRIEPPGTPPFSYSYDNEEFIPVKCNIHPWMHGYFVVLKTSHFAVTGDDGVFRLPDLPPGKYTVKAWHESLGTQSQEITVTPGESTSVYFAFGGKN
jgi:plastocyanin